jgi:hypothetical protein
MFSRADVCLFLIFSFLFCNSSFLSLSPSDPFLLSSPNSSICSFFTSEEFCYSSSSSQLHSLRQQCSDESAYLSLDLLKSHPQCRMGFSRVGFYANSLQIQEDKCMNRGYSDRNHLYSRWNSLQLTSLHSSIDLLFSLFSNSNSSIVDLIFLGDSVSSQLCQFLICDLIRLGIPLSSPPEHSQVQSFNHTITEFSFSFSFLNRFLLKSHKSQNRQKRILRIHNKQFNLPCMNLSHPDCRHFLSSSVSSSLSPPSLPSLSAHRDDGIHLISHFMKNLIHSFTNVSSWTHQRATSSHSPSPSPSSLYLILNYGLHLKKIHQSWAIPGMMVGILEEAKKFKKKRPEVHFFWRETSAQSFGYSKGTYCTCPVLLHLLIPLHLSSVQMVSTSGTRDKFSTMGFVVKDLLRIQKSATGRLTMCSRN